MKADFWNKHTVSISPNKEIPKGCAGYWTENEVAYDFDCGYYTTIDCKDCKYGKHGGRKDPEAKINQIK